MLTFMPGEEEVCTTIRAGLDDVVETTESFDLILLSGYSIDTSQSVITVNIIDSDSKKKAFP